MPSATQLAERYNALDRTHAQIDPRAYEIVVRNGGAIPQGRRLVEHPDPEMAGVFIASGPNFRGLGNDWWRALAHNNPDDFRALVRICMDDFPTACALILHIVSRLDSRVQTFIFNNGQLLLWNAMVARMRRGEPMFFVVLKARQLGITTFVAAWHFWNLWRASDIHTLNVAHSVALATRIVGFFRVFYDHLPPVADLRPRLRAENRNGSIPKSELYFSDSRSHGETHVAKNLDPRGNTSKYIGESEAAFYPDLESFNDALMPQLPAIGNPERATCSMIMESTPNGQNAFYEAWEETKEEGSEFWGIFLPWYIADDEYTAQAPQHWHLTNAEKRIQESLTAARMKIDGKPVTRNQMYWRHKTIQNKPFSGNEEAFNEAYPSDDETCFMLRSESVFKESMPYLHSCIEQAPVRAKEAWSARVDSRGNAIETWGAVVGRLDFKPLNSPFETVYYRKFDRPKFVFDGSGDLTVWEPPVRDHIYFIASDTAEGELGRDESTIFVLDCTTGRQVAEYASSRTKPEDFCDICVHLAIWYNMAMWLPEVNGLGSVVMKRAMNDWGYANVAHEEKWDEAGVKKDKPGFYTSDRNRPLIFSSLRWMVEERYLVISSKRLLKQMSTFKKDGMEYRTAKKNQHDDLVVAAGLACIGVRQAPKFLMSLSDARRDRAPTAVDLGLNHSPSPPVVRNDDTGLIAQLFGKDDFMMPINPLRGYGW